MVKVPGLRVEKKRLVWGKVDLWGSGDGEGGGPEDVGVHCRCVFS